MLSIVQLIMRIYIFGYLWDVDICRSGYWSHILRTCLRLETQIVFFSFYDECVQIFDTMFAD